MHPLFHHWRRFLVYLSVWLQLGVWLGVVVYTSGRGGILEGAAIMTPLMLLLGFVCLAFYYVCRAVPLRSMTCKNVLRYPLCAMIVAAAGVMLIGRLIAELLTQVWPGMDAFYSAATPVLTVFVALTCILSIAVHYIWLEIEASRSSEVLAREAQLKALKAQINPHFLFNSLNSISALTSINATAAREMCVGLADFLRVSLRLGERDTVPFGEEMALTDMYLSVEQARFGKRLRLIRDIDPACERCEVPALLIQPLVENAVKHGIAMMAEGGEILISGHRENDLLSFSVSNPFDPEAPAQARNGIGLRNVRERLEARYGNAAKMQVDATERNYRVTLTLPARTL